MQDRDASGAVLIDIDAELSCWQQMDDGATSELVFLFHEWEPAIRVGIHAYLTHPECDFDSLRPEMFAAYQKIRGRSPISWERAAPAARRVWQKLQDESLLQDPYAERATTPYAPAARASSTACGPGAWTSPWRQERGAEQCPMETPMAEA